MIINGVPPSTNMSYKITCKSGYAKMYLTDKAQAFKGQVQHFAKQAGYAPTTDPIRVDITMTCKNKHRRDLDGICKLILDSMNKVAYKDDSQIIELHAYKKFGKVAQTEIKVYRLVDEKA